MELGDRIKLIRNDESQKDFGTKFGVNFNTVRRYESGTNPPDALFISAICQRYNINPSWLLFGLEPMHNDQALDIPSTHQGNFGPTKRFDQESFDLIPMVETRLSAGGGAFVESENVEGYYAFRKSWIKKVTSGPKDLVLMRVIGDSMSPTIQARDTVMIDTSRRIIIEGEIFAIRFDNTIMIKRLAFRPGGRILVISDNRKEYEPYEADTNDLHIIGQIIFFSRSLIPD